MSDSTRKTSMRRLTDPSGSGAFVDVKVIDEISFIDPKSYYQEVRFILDNSDQSSRKVRVQTVTGSDGSSTIDVERVLQWNVSDPKSYFQEWDRITANDVNEPPIHLKTHDFKVVNPTNSDWWVIVRRVDEVYYADPKDYYQEYVYSLQWDDDDSDNPSELNTDYDGTTINPPWRLDMFQDVVDAHWGSSWVVSGRPKNSTAVSVERVTGTGTFISAVGPPRSAIPYSDGDYVMSYAAGNGKQVVIANHTEGDSLLFVSSDNGATWTPVPGLNFDSQLMFGNGVFVTTFSRDVTTPFDNTVSDVYYSEDGEHWTFSGFTTSFSIQNISFTGGKFFIGEFLSYDISFDIPTNTIPIATSDDGKSWSEASIAPTVVFSEHLKNIYTTEVSFGNGVYVACMSWTEITIDEPLFKPWGPIYTISATLVSGDGRSWSSPNVFSNGPFGLEGVNTVTFGDGKFVLGGNFAFGGTGSASQIATSVDGAGWGGFQAPFGSGVGVYGSTQFVNVESIKFTGSAFLMAVESENVAVSGTLVGQLWESPNASACTAVQTSTDMWAWVFIQKG